MYVALKELLERLPLHQHGEYASAYQAEHDAELAVRTLARALVQLAAPVWHFGDGQGGWVHDMIAEAAGEIGLPIELGLPRPPTTLAERIAARDGGFYCNYCTAPLVGSPEVPRTEIDHVIPKSRGGSDGIANRVLACASCNRAKGARTAEEFVAATQ